MNDEQEHYTVLGLPPGAPVAQVRSQFRLLAKRLHPDVHGGDDRYHEQFRRIHAAYEFLADPHHKAAYDVSAPEDCPASVPDDADTPVPLWVHVGASRPAPQTAVDSHPTEPRRHPRMTLGRAARSRLSAALTWSLTGAALFLIVVMMRPPPADAGLTPFTRQPAITATAQTVDAPPAADTTDTLPASSPVTGDPPSAPFRAWEPPSALHTMPDTPDPTPDTQYAVDPKYLVDPKYTTIDPHEITVDPAITAVDPQAVSIDAHITAVDSRYTGIDPKLTSP